LSEFGLDEVGPRNYSGSVRREIETAAQANARCLPSRPHRAGAPIRICANSR